VSRGSFPSWGCVCRGTIVRLYCSSCRWFPAFRESRPRTPAHPHSTRTPALYPAARNHGIDIDIVVLTSASGVGTSFGIAHGTWFLPRTYVFVALFEAFPVCLAADEHTCTRLCPPPIAVLPSGCTTMRRRPGGPGARPGGAKDGRAVGGRWPQRRRVWRGRLAGAHRLLLLQRTQPVRAQPAAQRERGDWPGGCGGTGPGILSWNDNRDGASGGGRGRNGAWSSVGGAHWGVRGNP
jgi:hypothetical protein